MVDLLCLGLHIITKTKHNSNNDPIINNTNTLNQVLSTSLNSLINMLNSVPNNSPYVNDLLKDTKQDKKHGRIYYSFENRSNWQNFGMFHLKCILMPKYRILIRIK